MQRLVLRSLGYKQSLFSSKIHGGERKQLSVHWSRVLVTNEAAAQLAASSLAPRISYCIRSVFFAFFPADFRVKERLLAVYTFSKSIYG